MRSDDLVFDVRVLVYFTCIAQKYDLCYQDWLKKLNNDDDKTGLFTGLYEKCNANT